MALIPMDELMTLKAASAVKTVADNALADQQEKEVAYAINTAANTGEYDVAYNGKLIDSVKTKLEADGYTVTYDVALMNSEDIAHISWKE